MAELSNVPSEVLVHEQRSTGMGLMVLIGGACCEWLVSIDGRLFDLSPLAAVLNQFTIPIGKFVPLLVNID